MSMVSILVSGAEDVRIDRGDGRVREGMKHARWLRLRAKG